MMTKLQMKNIQAYRGSTTFDLKFIQDFDEQWDKTTMALKTSGVCLDVPIVSPEVKRVCAGQKIW